MQDVMFVKFHIHFSGSKTFSLVLSRGGGGGGHPDLEIGEGEGGS